MRQAESCRSDTSLWDAEKLFTTENTERTEKNLFDL